MWIPLKEGIGGESRSKDRVTLRLTLLCDILRPCAWQCSWFPPFQIRFILSSPLGPLLVTPSCQCFCHRVLEFLPFVLVAWYGFFLFICFVVYALPFYVYVFWHMVFDFSATSSCYLMSPTCSWSTHSTVCHWSITPLIMLITILVTRVAFGGCLFLTCVIHVFYVLGTTPLVIASSFLLLGCPLELASSFLCNVYFALYCVSNFCTCVIFTIFQSIYTMHECNGHTTILWPCATTQMHLCIYLYSLWLKWTLILAHISFKKF